MNIYLPFTIGGDYEFWEFQLEIKEDKLKNYDSYRYLGTVDIFSLVTNHVELIFNYDILELVILTYQKVKKDDFIRLQNLIIYRLGEGKPLKNKNLEIDIYLLDGEYELWLSHNTHKNEFQIAYGNCDILKELYL